VLAALESKKINDKLRLKISDFIDKLNEWREEEKYLPLNELIWKIYNQTDYYNYVRLLPSGEIRKANLKMFLERAKEYEKISFKGLFSFIRYIEKIKNSNNDLSAAKLIGENENVVRIMSIHKSKGLEFPVAIISRADKKFNERELSDSILLHQDIGFGPQYINYDKKIEYTTAAKEAIKIKLKNESIAEEMRILYVALTRAKEKLIITGVENDLEKALEEKKELLENYEKENGKINHLLLKKYKSYLGWLQLVYLNNENISEYMKLNKISKKDILKEDEKQEIKTEIRDIKKTKEYDKITEILNWKYKYEDITKLQSKMSVTKIKELKTKEEKKQQMVEIKPRFMQEDGRISGAEKGTLIHLILQRLNLRKSYTKKDIQEFVEKLYMKKIISEAQKNVIPIEKIYQIMNSDFMSKVRNAKEIYKEQPFYTYISTKEIYDTESDENTLVQGIIDLYYIDENNDCILVDYKTDYVQNETELIEKYKVQLEIYKKALEDALKTKIKECYIYSIYLNKEIRIF